MPWYSIDEPDSAARATAIVAHGAGGNRDAVVLAMLGSALAAKGVRTIRIDLPYRRLRPTGPPSPSGQPADRAAFAATAHELGVRGPLVWGGHSYGGRMASMAVAEGPDSPDLLLLSSYPLHPPGKPERARTEHLPAITVPTVFVHGVRDPFATPDELAAAAGRITGPTTIVSVSAAHDLAPAKSDAPELAAQAVIAALDSLG